MPCRSRAPSLPRRSPALAAVAVVTVALLAGCGAADRVPMAEHGLGRLAYRQLIAVSRAAEAPPPSEPGDAFAQDEADAQEPTPAPAARTDLPPGSWVAGFPAPEVQPVPAPQAAPTPQAEPAAPEEAPRRNVAEAPAPQIDPRLPEEPAPVADPGPSFVATAPGAWDGQGAGGVAEAPVQPSPEAPNVTMVVVVPVVPVPLVVGRGYAIPQAPVRPRLGVTPPARSGGGRAAVSARR